LAWNAYEGRGKLR